MANIGPVRRVIEVPAPDDVPQREPVEEPAWPVQVPEAEPIPA